MVSRTTPTIIMSTATPSPSSPPRLRPSSSCLGGVHPMPWLMAAMLCVVAVAVIMPMPADALDCYQCGMYNDGVGSITHCLNYSEALAHRYLRKCPHGANKFCIVSISQKVGISRHIFIDIAILLFKVEVEVRHILVYLVIFNTLGGIMSTKKAKTN